MALRLSGMGKVLSDCSPGKRSATGDSGLNAYR